MSNLNELLEIMIDHREQDRLIRGMWLSDKEVNGKFKGCFYGCAMQTEDNPIEKACEKYGLPLWMGYWSEKAYEHLPEDVAFDFPVNFLKAVINSKQDLERVKHKLAIKRLTRLSGRNKGRVKRVIDGVIACHQRYLAGEIYIDWFEDRSAARSAAWSTTCFEARVEDRSAARSAAWSAACSAARVEDRSAARSAAESAAWKQEVNDMYEILKDEQ